MNLNTVQLHNRSLLLPHIGSFHLWD